MNEEELEAAFQKLLAARQLQPSARTDVTAALAREQRLDALTQWELARRLPQFQATSERKFRHSVALSRSELNRLQADRAGQTLKGLEQDSITHKLELIAEKSGPLLLRDS